MNGIIVKVISNDYTVKVNNEYIICKARGKFRNKNISPLVGDYVIINKDKKIIEDILKRKNYLVRPPVSNIDLALIVTSVKDPDFSSNLLDKMINIIEFNNITPIIVITKYDLLDDTNEINNIISYYKKIGYNVFINNEVADIKKLFDKKIVILTGQTGAGKSTLLNNLDNNLTIKTREISKALGRGKHTTRHTELYEVSNGLIADTPGFSSLEFIDMKKEDIRDNFIEFEKYKDECKYRDCMHINEDDCEVKRKVIDGTILNSRYENYIKFVKGSK